MPWWRVNAWLSLDYDKCEQEAGVVQEEPEQWQLLELCMPDGGDATEEFPPYLP